MAALLLALALVAGATGAYLLAGDTLRALRYATPAPAVIVDPGAGSPVATGPITPTRIHIPAIGVRTIVEPAPATEEPNPFTGDVVSTFPVPGGPHTTVWWEEGPMPGSDGLAVVLGHTKAFGSAVFDDLPDLDPGVPVGITGRTAGGAEVIARYVVADVVTGISKSDPDALRAVLESPPPGAALALITCSGEIDGRLSSREDNTVVFATLEGTYTP
ncbi:sortase [Nostocoides sp. F2B08]|uniref:class F sortase n=1 Tax=Nostocoides sp. F2B08 TaxID=2653936 RepID=UPI0012633525|nr:class F sortase [Tetrasphaera sp. F2B08]KAB7743541.1 sortase [Tetrasphaera sp. F2B08]